ncbi:hypothetical protein J7J84_02120 [bacterium]|nr:hypothetical protein [bacterium]
MRKLHLFHAIGLLIIFTAAVACTSSSTTTRTNPNYNQDYSRSTRSRQSSQTGSAEGFPEETYRPPVTLMMLSMTTGEVLEGESYPVIAVVDNPENRDLTYRWSVEDGKLGELPESMRGEMLSFKEQLRSNKGVPSQAPEGEAVTEELPPAPAAEGMEGPPTGVPAAAQPPGAKTEGRETGARPAPKSKPSTGSEPSAKTQPEGAESAGALEQPEQPAEEPEEVAEGAESAPADSGSEKPEDGESRLVAMNRVRYAALGPDEAGKGDAVDEDWPEPQPKETDEGAAVEKLPEQVDEAEDTEATEDTVEEDAAGEEPAAEELAASEAVADKEEIEGKVEEIGETAESFEGFKPTVGEGRLVEPVVEPEENEDENSLLDAAPSLVIIETDKPYVLWTPPGLGSYTIRCIVLDDKGNEVTPERSFPVTVTKPEPKTELVWNTSQKLYEDDYLVVEVRVKNVPSYSKGLFTLSFDPTELSFRLVETGDFFADGYRTSLFYAQPPNNPGKVTIAIAADEVGLPKGDGVAARAIFKVKETLNDPSQLNISEVMTEESRYILDAEGNNVLPLVVEHPIYATEWTEPPARPQQSRTETRGERTGMPSTPEPPGAARTSGGGSSGQPASGTQSGITPHGSSGRLGGQQQTAAGTETEQPPVEDEFVPPTSGPFSIQGLEARKVQIMEDESLTEEQKEQMLIDIDLRIQQLLEAGAEPGGEPSDEAGAAIIAAPPPG